MNKNEEIEELKKSIEINKENLNVLGDKFKELTRIKKGDFILLSQAKINHLRGDYYCRVLDLHIMGNGIELIEVISVALDIENKDISKNKILNSIIEVGKLIQIQNLIYGEYQFITRKQFSTELNIAIQKINSTLKQQLE